MKKFVRQNNKEGIFKEKMFQPIIARHDSSLVTLSSADAITTDDVYGNGKFMCQLVNANRGGTHAIKIIPNLVMIPNVFNNVYTRNADPDGAGGMNRFAFGAVNNRQFMDIGVGFYTRDEFVAAFNAQGGLPSNTRIGVTASGFLQFIDVGNAPYTISMKKEMASMLGFVDDGKTVTVEGVWTSVKVQKLGQNTAQLFPNMGTTPVVYVVAKQLALNNMVASDSKEYNVIATVSMHNVARGAYGMYRGADIFLEDIDFRTPRSLDQIDFELLDYRYNKLFVDKRFPVIIQLKVYHLDTFKG